MRKFVFSLVVFSAISISGLMAQAVDGFVKVDPAASNISWVGKKVTGQHSGVVPVKEGSLQFKKGMLIGGNLTIDVAGLTVTDIQGDGAKNLEGHLKADDFFGTDKFPTATVIVTDVTSTVKGEYNVKANLTIKGITQPIEFKTVVMPDGKKQKATAEISVDRTKYDIKYGSGKFFDNLGDKTIHDNFDLTVVLIAG